MDGKGVRQAHRVRITAMPESGGIARRQRRWRGKNHMRYTPRHRGTKPNRVPKAAAVSVAATAAMAVPFMGLASPASADGTKDRKSTRLNSSHVAISYAVFCLNKKDEQEPAQ